MYCSGVAKIGHKIVTVSKKYHFLPTNQGPIKVILRTKLLFFIFKFIVKGKSLKKVY